MSQKGRTPDEKFLIRLHEIAAKAGDLEAEIEVELVAKSLRLRATAMGTIVKQLAQANLIKKVGGTHIRLTSRGIGFVEDELENPSK